MRTRGPLSSVASVVTSAAIAASGVAGSAAVASSGVALSAVGGVAVAAHGVGVAIERGIGALTVVVGESVVLLAAVAVVEAVVVVAAAEAGVVGHSSASHEGVLPPDHGAAHATGLLVVLAHLVGSGLGLMVSLMLLVGEHFGFLLDLLSLGAGSLLATKSHHAHLHELTHLGSHHLAGHAHDHLTSLGSGELEGALADFLGDSLESLPASLGDSLNSAPGSLDTSLNAAVGSPHESLGLLNESLGTSLNGSEELLEELELSFVLLGNGSKELLAGLVFGVDFSEVVESLFGLEVFFGEFLVFIFVFFFSLSLGEVVVAIGVTLSLNIIVRAGVRGCLHILIIGARVTSILVEDVLDFFLGHVGDLFLNQVKVGHISQLLLTEGLSRLSKSSSGKDGGCHGDFLKHLFVLIITFRVCLNTSY